MHADHHWEGVNDFHENEEARERLLTADLTEIEAMVRNEDRIQYDSFIAPGEKSECSMLSAFSAVIIADAELLPDFGGPGVAAGLDEEERRGWG